MGLPFNAKDLGIFLGKFSVAYALLLCLHVSTALPARIHSLLLATTSGLLAADGNVGLDHAVSLHEDGRIHVQASADGFRVSRDIRAIYANNIYIFIALVLATPRLGFRRCTVSLLVGIGILLILNSLIMLGKIFEIDARYPELRQVMPNGVVAAVARAALPLSPTGGVYMLPAFLWGFVMLSVPAARPASVTVGRNASCPCGSQRKYKNCCGR